MAGRRVKESDLGPFTTRTSRSPSLGHDRGEILRPSPWYWQFATTTVLAGPENSLVPARTWNPAGRNVASVDQNPAKYRPRPSAGGSRPARATMAAPMPIWATPRKYRTASRPPGPTKVPFTTSMGNSFSPPSSAVVLVASPGRPNVLTRSQPEPAATT